MILALDIGSRYVGWAAGSAPAAARFGTYTLPKLDSATLGRSYALFSGWLSDMLTMHKPQSLYFECPFTLKQEVIARSMLFYAGQVEHLAYLREVDCAEVNASSVRSYFLRATPRTRPDGAPLSQDDRIGMECVRRGFTPSDTHQADALALHAFAWADRTRRVA